MKKTLIVIAITIIIVVLISFKLLDKNINLEKLSMDLNTKEFIAGFDKDYVFSTDTLYTNEADAYSERPVKFGLSHDMVVSKFKPIAKFQAISYNKLNVMETKTGEFIALGAVSDISSQKDFDNTVSDLTAKYGKPKTADTEFFGKYKHYIWTTDDRMIELVFGTKTGEGVLNIVVDQDKKSIGTTPPEETQVSYLFIVKKKYIAYLEGQVSKSGDWVHMH